MTITVRVESDEDGKRFCQEELEGLLEVLMDLRDRNIEIEQKLEAGNSTLEETQALMAETSYFLTVTNEELADLGRQQKYLCLKSLPGALGDFAKRFPATLTFER